MDERLAKLLHLVTEDVITTGEPVGSQRIVDAYKLTVSSATIRNWFTELEEAGFVSQPHTSSGRMPTEKGYRTYIEELMESKPLSRHDRHMLEKAIENIDDPDKRSKELAKAISERIGNAVILGLHRSDSFYTGLSQLFSQPEFRDWNRVVNLGEILDRLDDVLAGIREQRYPAPQVLIGQECPFGSACGSILLTMPNGSLMAILGPMRMDYRFGISLLQAGRELLKSSI
ncbi:hypothetical protein IT408_01890 [Candidatus Uhrbacteria bacterium]|nr:hypothetical protein [Candidatus Uhrbacteria bacterium]